MKCKYSTTYDYLNINSWKDEDREFQRQRLQSYRSEIRLLREERDEDSRDDASGAGRRAREVSGCSRWDCLLTPVLCAVSRACPGLHVMLSIDTDHDPQRPSCTKM